MSRSAIIADQGMRQTTPALTEPSHGAPRAGSISPPALFRAVEQFQPTILDETEKYIEHGGDLHALLMKGIAGWLSVAVLGKTRAARFSAPVPLREMGDCRVRATGQPSLKCSGDVPMKVSPNCAMIDANRAQQCVAGDNVSIG
jgi:hypothetical protein